MTTLPKKLDAPSIKPGHAISELVVPVLGTTRYERGIAFAALFAEVWDVPIVLVHVHRPATEDVAEAEMAAIAAANKRLIAGHPRVASDGVTVEHDDIAAGITSIVTPGSLIVVATEHAAQWSNSLSIAEQVVLASDQPVLLAGPNCAAPTFDGPILVPLDGSTVAEQALSAGQAMAESFDTSLWLATVVGDNTVRQVAELHAKGEDVSESAYIKGAAESLSTKGGGVGWEVIHGDDPVGGLLRFAVDSSVSMIVASTHGASGVTRLAFGSTCMGLVERGPMPVLVMRSDSSTLQLSS